MRSLQYYANRINSLVRGPLVVTIPKTTPNECKERLQQSFAAAGHATIWIVEGIKVVRISGKTLRKEDIKQ